MPKITAAPVSASMLTTEMLSGRMPSRSGPASPPSSRMLYRPSIGAAISPPEKTVSSTPMRRHRADGARSRRRPP